jgi:hypothetical protein
VSDDAAGLERLLLTDFGAGATAAEFDAVAVRALALMGAKDSVGRALGDAEFMRPVKKTCFHDTTWGVLPAELVLGVPEALDGAVAAGLLGRLTEGEESRFARWVKGTRGLAGDAGEGTVASAGDTVAQAARVVLVTALLARATSGEALEKEAMLGQLGWARLHGAHLRGAQLQKADLCKAQLQKADLGGAQLQGAILMGAQLQKTSLSWVNLVGVQAHKADLTGAKLRWATVGAEPDKDTEATNLIDVCAPAPCIRSLWSYHSVTRTDVGWG